jgi:hypothetical protein
MKKKINKKNTWRLKRGQRNTKEANTSRYQNISQYESPSKSDHSAQNITQYEI